MQAVALAAMSITRPTRPSCHGESEAILDRLGFTRTAEVNKWRENYLLDTASVSLDSVEELGTFVEIEVLAERDDNAAAAQIERISKEIGVEGEPILASYLELLLAKRSGVQS